jgi:hypothetical protein
MAKAKSKGSLGQFLLNKGEYVAMGAAAFFLVVLFGWGVSRWSSAKDPGALSKKMSDDARSLQSRIAKAEPSEEELKQWDLPPWLVQKPTLIKVEARELPLTVPQFDPIARPDTKRENPTVIKLENYQVDVVKVPMKGYDIQKLKKDEVRIGVITAKAVGEQDKKKLEGLGKSLRERVKMNQKNFARNQGAMPPGVMPPGGMGMPPMGMPPMGMGGNTGYTGYNPYGVMGGTGYNVAAQRTDKAVNYIPIEELDKSKDTSDAVLDQAAQVMADVVSGVRAGPGQKTAARSEP